MKNKSKAIKLPVIEKFAPIVRQGRYKFRIVDHYRGTFCAKSNFVFIWLFRKNGRLFLAITSRKNFQPNLKKIGYVANIPDSVKKFEEIIRTVYAHIKGKNVSEFRYFVKRVRQQNYITWNHWFKPGSVKKQQTTALH